MTSGPRSAGSPGSGLEVAGTGKRHKLRAPGSESAPVGGHLEAGKGRGGKELAIHRSFQRPAAQIVNEVFQPGIVPDDQHAFFALGAIGQRLEESIRALPHRRLAAT